MSAGEEPVTVQRIEEAEEKIVASAEVAAQVTEELSRFGDANFDTVTQLSDHFLTNVRDAQAILQDVIRQLPPAAPYRGRSYIQRLQAEAAAAAKDAVAADGPPVAHSNTDAAEAMDSASATCSSGSPQETQTQQAAAQQAHAGSSADNGNAAAGTVLPGRRVISGSNPASEAAPARSFVPTATATYLRPDYWDARFGVEDSYEWCKDYSEFRHLVAPQLKPTDRILELGCGNSGLGAALAADGFQHVTCTDLSSVAVERMQRKAAAAGSHVQYQVADMLQLPFSAGSFDVVIEKGALEVFFTDSPSAWDPTPAARRRFSKAIDEAHRILAPGGALISVSFGQPHFRVPLLLACRRHSWDCRAEGFGELLDYFVYVLHKGRRQEAASSGRQHADHAAGCLGVALGPQVRVRGADQQGPMHEHMDDESYLMQMTL